MKLLATLLLTAACVLPFSLHAAPLDDAITELQRDWEVIRYQTPESARLKRFEALSAKAHGVSQTFAGRSEPLVWEGIIVSSLANEKGGLGALSLAKQAKAMYEQAIALGGDTLQGSAYGSLAVLYYKVPGWPLGFGDKAKAEELLKKALSLNPTGIDPNYFYADFLVETGRGSEAASYLERALAAPPRPGREVADTGRREEVRQLLTKVKAM
ncbi:tetratricopeptide repeat protein [Rhodoferax sp. BLA1]|uniref:tetratricopeptide repeat protein n=1 Tax=Rhodoferax sp. BLA1 TaxID=2576062 RepID=UPI0015D1BEC4|nr:tetratricopeptide repeat protein [Rhodoferax sp. BLA1]